MHITYTNNHRNKLAYSHWYIHTILHDYIHTFIHLYMHTYIRKTHIHSYIAYTHTYDFTFIHLCTYNSFYLFIKDIHSLMKVVYIVLDLKWLAEEQPSWWLKMPKRFAILQGHKWSSFPQSKKVMTLSGFMFKISNNTTPLSH